MCAPIPLGWSIGCAESPWSAINPDRRIITISPTRLLPSVAQFNCAIQEFKNKLILTYRVEHEPVNQLTRTAICELGLDFSPLESTSRLLDLPTIYGFNIAEDCRLVKDSNMLYCTYTDRGSMALARLSDSLEVASAQYIRYSASASIEKNWSIFPFEGSLYAVYSIAPVHRVLKLRLNFEQYHIAEEFAVTETAGARWHWGIPRGGATPVLVGDEYFSFFHSHYTDEGESGRTYVMGAYAFEAKPPFRVTQFGEVPLLWPTVLPKAQRAVNGHNVVFPCGAVFSSGNWVISYGENDLFCKLCILRHSTVLRSMARL